MAESARTWWTRWKFNHLFPAFRRTGGRIAYIADDWREVRVELPLNWATRNYVGTIFGGSLYAAADGHLMVMLIKLLGTQPKVDRLYQVDWTDRAGLVHASMEKTIHIRRKEAL